MKVFRNSYLPIIIIGLLFLLIYLVGTRVPETTIRAIIKSSGVFGPILLILFFWTTNVIAPLSGSPFLFAGFFLFGQKVIIYSFIAALIASITNFWLARIWGRAIVIKLAGKDNLEKIDNLTENYGLLTLFIIRIFLGSFHDVISYVFGLTKMQFIPYIVISVLGTIPGTILWYYLTSKINNPLIFTLLTWAMTYVFLTIYISWIKITKREKKFSKPNK